MKKIFRFLRILFVSLFIGSEKLRTDRRHEDEQRPIATEISILDNEQTAIEYLLSDECSIAYNPNSPEAIAETNFINKNFDSSFDYGDLQVTRGYVEDEEPAILLDEEEAEKLFNKNKIYHGSKETNIY